MKKIIKLTESDLTKMVKKIINESDFEKNIINIVSLSDVIDNYGSIKTTRKPLEIKEVLMDIDSWSDDMEFKDSEGNYYQIDDLINKYVTVGDGQPFKVPSDKLTDYDI